MDNISSATASATHTVAEALDSSGNEDSAKTSSSAKKDSQGNSKDKSPKDQLGEAAYTYTLPGEEKRQETLVEKSTRS